MPGGLLNIISEGNQNVILNGNPSKTFFKTTYLKYTNFGLQTFRVDYNGIRDINPSEDSVYTFKIPRNAELLLNTYFVFTLPDIWSTILPPMSDYDIWKPYHFKWIENIGTSIIKTIQIYIGSQIVQEYTGEYIRTIVERDYTEDKKKMFDLMSGNIDELHSPENLKENFNNYPNTFYMTGEDGVPGDPEPSIKGRKLYIPINAWYTYSSKQSVPLVSLQYSEMRIEITVRPISEIFTINNISDDALNSSNTFQQNGTQEIQDNLYKRISPSFTNNNHLLYRFLQPPPSITLKEDDYTNKVSNWNADAHLICTYGFLTEEESRVFALNEQKYLIKDIKHNVFYNISGTNKIKIDTNALVKSWVWFYRRSDVNLRNEWGNYTNWPTSKRPYNLISSENQTTLQLTGRATYGGAGTGPGQNPIGPSVGLNTNIKQTPIISVNNEKYILKKFTILLDGKFRENELDSEIFKYLENYRSSRLNKDIGLYSYNFCINTYDENQPSGAMNLNKFKNIEFEMTTIEPEIDPDSNFNVICDENGDIIGTNKQKSLFKYSYDLHLYEERYNILRFISGNAGLLFAR